jgi:hypothetical protein
MSSSLLAITTLNDKKALAIFFTAAVHHILSQETNI